jgi:hypothetical protein
VGWSRNEGGGRHTIHSGEGGEDPSEDWLEEKREEIQGLNEVLFVVMVDMFCYDRLKEEGFAGLQAGAGCDGGREVIGS